MPRGLPDPIEYSEVSGNTALDVMCGISEGMRIEGALVLERWLRQEEPELKNVALTTLAAIVCSHMLSVRGREQFRAENTKNKQSRLARNSGP